MVPESGAAFHCNKEKQSSCSAEGMPNADLHHIPEQAQLSFLAQHRADPVPAAGSPAGLSSPQDSNPLPACFPVGFAHVFEEQELLRGWTMGSSPAQQPGGWPGRLGASSTSEQVPPVSSPLPDKELASNQSHPLWYPGTPSCTLQERGNPPLK